MTTRAQLEQAIAVQETLRGTIDDAIIDATIDALRRQIDSLDPQPASQRKLATVLFMDIAGHTGLIQRLDPEVIMELVDGALQRLAVPVAQFGGQIVRYQGDGYKAVFGLSVATEDDPDHAIRAGLAVVQLAAEIAAEWQAEGLPGFNVRVGIDSGLVLVGGGTEGEDAVTGLPVNLAARLESAAEPGTVLISHHTYLHVRGVFDFAPQEPVIAKGFPEPVPVYRVLRAKGRSFRNRRRGVEGVVTRMIGRDAELAQLQAAYRQMLATPQARMITLVGEAGLGKSRLMSEFENWADLQPESVHLFRGRARSETQRQPFGLLRDIFVFRFGIYDDDSPQTVRDKLVAGFQQALDDPMTAEIQAHFIGHLIGYDFSDSPHVRPLLDNPQRLRAQTLSYLTSYFKTITAQAPMVALLEDLHWADDSSLDSLPGLMETLSGRALLIIGAGRPDLYVRRPGWLDGYAWHDRVVLDLLNPTSSKDLVNEVLQRVEQVPDSLRSLIVQRAEGNPFYLEELVKMFIEEGVIVKDDLTWWVRPERLATTTIPPTLTGVLQARLDALPGPEKAALQRASVVGRLFWDSAVDYLDDKTAEQRLLSARPGLWEGLNTREFVYRRDESAFENTQEYVFMHAMLRDVTYETVLHRLRRRYHERTAEWLIATSGQRAEEYAEVIARHFALAENRVAEAEWQQRAGTQAAARYAHPEALLALGRALELTPPENLPQRFELLLQREAIYNLQAEREEQVADLAELQLLADQMGDRQHQTQVALRQAAHLTMIGDYSGALEVARAAAGWADADQNVDLQAAVYLRLGTLLMRLGEYDAAEAHYRRALDYCQASDSPRIEMECLRMLGVLSDEMGKHEEELHYFERALELATSIQDRWGERRALNSLGVTLFGLGDLSRAKMYYEKSLSVAHELGDRLGEGTVLGNLGTLAATLGDYKRAEALFREALQNAKLIEDLVGQCTLLLNLGSVVTALGRPEEALAFYDEALHLSTTMGDRPTIGYVYAGQGFSLLALGRLAEAEAALKQSIELRDEMGQSHLVIESRAGLAAVYLAMADAGRALAEVDQVLQFLETSTIEYSEEYYRILHICYEVLRAAQDPRTMDILNTAYHDLQKTAAGLDESSRQHLLENVAWNRAIVSAWAAEQEEP